MYGLKKRSKQDENGLIQGAGTGSSDDVKKNVPAGSYIMPSDSTKTLGIDNLKNMGSPIPVNLSNGEFQLSPDQVHSVGVQTLDAMKEQTHTPVDQPQLGFKPGNTKPQMFFANGGLVPFDEEAARRAQSGTQMRDVTPTTRQLPAISNNSTPPSTANTLMANEGGFGARMLGKAANAAKGLGAFHMAASGIGGAVTGFNTPTDDYRERFGMETNNPTLVGDLGIRGLGVLSDVGNAASFGILGRNFADKQRVNAENTNSAQQKRFDEWNFD
ncbi:hypothetical protein [Acinetobacter ursingii]|uniref:Uncharacterized protein n=2 Tax=Acinetobacter ursingii TaxID=108980 RepID=A0A3D2SJZ7_9GAMM|nr:hypothetical protein [Acinetobacter ursingii]MCH2003980.1 hypothetical protein [Acinetobacter ursingii]MCU4380708.1 hypothetical protein [Acinetobacter ursingii]MCU4608270.1 hypothetical protein [Acinetobacter ursingii]HCK29034.1 hypothetical protein [Acinetobacter ursingii]